MQNVDMAGPMDSINETTTSSVVTPEEERDMSYLTTHDLVWINTVVTGDPNAYDYVTLESVMAGQYRYGDSQNVPAQAAQMLRRLLKHRPFSYGNLRTALIATLTFLNANGYATIVKEEEAARIILATSNGEMDPAAAVLLLGVPAKEALSGVSLRRLITHECNLHVEALQILATYDDVAIAAS